MPGQRRAGAFFPARFRAAAFFAGDAFAPARFAAAFVPLVCLLSIKTPAYRTMKPVGILREPVRITPLLRYSPL